MLAHRIRSTRQLQLEIEASGENWPEVIWDSLPEPAHRQVCAALARLLVAKSIPGAGEAATDERGRR